MCPLLISGALPENLLNPPHQIERVGKEGNGVTIGLRTARRTDHPSRAHEQRPGGILYREGIAKISQFSRSCNDDGLPIVWLHDISGFDRRQP